MRAENDILLRERTDASFDVMRVREDFPILKTRVHGKPLVYLDNAATSQKPVQVIEAIRRFYEQENSNVHRGVHYLSEYATREYEAAREKVRQFIHASSSREVVFVRGTTEGINLVAQSFVRPRARKGNEILLTAMEHHSNIVPWQIVCEQTGMVLRVAPMNDDGDLIVHEYEKLINEKTALVAMAHVSNALGTVNPVKRLIALAQQRGVPVLLDGAQAVPHMNVDVRELGCDFYTFSSHKMYGPTGIGVLYGREDLLAEMPPYQGGGDMIKSVTFEKTIYNDLPYKFEAGTPNIAGTIGFGSAIDYMTSLGMQAISAHERDLLTYATSGLLSMKEFRIVGTAKEKASVLSFVLEGVHPHDIGTILDQSGVAVRTGHHCAQPVMQRFGIPATARASFGIYNTVQEVDALLEALENVRRVMT